MAVFGAEDSEAAGFSGDFDEEVPFHPRCNDDPIYVSAWGMYPGAMGHEILHALGAVHPEGCGSSGPGGEHGPSIMCWGTVGLPADLHRPVDAGGPGGLPVHPPLRPLEVRGIRLVAEGDWIHLAHTTSGVGVPKRLR